jgi:CRP-like cAMP-binding protein
MARATSAPASGSLAGIAIFAALPPDTMARIQQRCSWRSYEAGEPILDYLDPSDDVYFIISGEVRVTIYSVSGKAVTFRDLGPGEIFGEYPAIDRAPRSASVEARSRCTLASMPAGSFRHLLDVEPALTRALLPHLVAKIRALTTRVYEFSTLAVNNRIHAELLRLASLAPREGRSARIYPVPTHSEIASRISTHREAVTRELNRLARLGVIERCSSALLVKDVERLESMVHQATGE